MKCYIISHGISTLKIPKKTKKGYIDVNVTDRFDKRV